MYLYFNKEGILETIIPHGETVRQGSYLNIYVLLDDDFFSSRGDSQDQYSINVELAFPNNTIGTVNAVPVDEPTIKPFERLDDSEITYSLEEGKEYWTYHFRFTPAQSTMYAGKIFALVSIMQTTLIDPDDMESAVEEDLLYYGKADIYVEKVFGAARRTVNEGELHYKNLVTQLNELNKRKVTKGYETINTLSFVIKEEKPDIIKEIMFEMIYNVRTGTFLYENYLTTCYEKEEEKYSVVVQSLADDLKIYTTSKEYTSEELKNQNPSYIAYNVEERKIRETILEMINKSIKEDGTTLIINTNFEEEV